jgi:hypothetical protein
MGFRQRHYGAFGDPVEETVRLRRMKLTVLKQNEDVRARTLVKTRLSIVFPDNV